MAKKKKSAKKKIAKEKKPRVKKIKGEMNHLEQNSVMKHENFPAFLRKNFDKAGKKINE